MFADMLPTWAAIRAGLDKDQAKGPISSEGSRLCLLWSAQPQACWWMVRSAQVWFVRQALGVGVLCAPRA